MHIKLNYYCHSATGSPVPLAQNVGCGCLNWVGASLVYGHPPTCNLEVPVTSSRGPESDSQTYVQSPAPESLR